MNFHERTTLLRIEEMGIEFITLVEKFKAATAEYFPTLRQTYFCL